MLSENVEEHWALTWPRAIHGLNPVCLPGGSRAVIHLVAPTTEGEGYIGTMGSTSYEAYGRSLHGSTPRVIALGAGERLTLALYHATYKYPGCLGFRV